MLRNVKRVKLNLQFNILYYLNTNCNETRPDTASNDLIPLQEAANLSHRPGAVQLRLLAKRHTVTFGDGQLIASSESGYFSCDLVDCVGSAQAILPEEDRGLVDVVEFYHPDLDHYFITATEGEATAIDQGAAGPGWVRTGEHFNAWSIGWGGRQSWRVAEVCRFYGSLKPGPNSHFYSALASEYKFLMDLQELVPDDKPRWNFEGYAFSVPPVAPSGPPCSEDAIPVYRAYNNGFDLRIDSNHRYMTDPELVAEVVEKGWIDEGIAFCSPAN